MFSWAKQFKNVLCRVCTKKLINLKLRKMSILALNFYFLGQNKLKMGFSNLNILKKDLIMQDMVIRVVEFSSGEYKNRNIFA